jgi:hypothetical protein
VPFDGPGAGQPDGTMGRKRDKRLESPRIGQMSRLQPCVVEPPRPALGRGLLIATAACQLAGQPVCWSMMAWTKSRRAVR